MKAVIFAAGQSTRTYPLTVNKPKPLLKIANKTILGHNLEQLDGLIDEAIIIIGFRGEMIKAAFGDKFKNIKITYVEQKERLGTWHALSQTKEFVNGKFIAMNGDDLYHRNDMVACLKHDYAVLAQKVTNPERFGVIILKENFIADIIEKPKEFVSDLANTGFYVLQDEIFNIPMQKSERTGEYEIVDALKNLAKSKKIVCEIVKEYWFPTGYPWDLIETNKILLDKITKSDIKGTVDKNVTINGNIVVGEGTVILNGTFIEGNILIGKNCKIGPNCYLRGNTSIGDGCHIGQAVEIKNSIIADGAKVPHLSYVGDSYIGENTNLGAGTITANLRHDNASVKSMVKGQLVDSGRRKLGAIIAENVHTGIGTMIYPGRKLWPNTTTRPGDIVQKDIVA